MNQFHQSHLRFVRAGTLKAALLGKMAARGQWIPAKVKRSRKLEKPNCQGVGSHKTARSRDLYGEDPKKKN